ncbi:MAG: DNA-methyltransferase [Mycobacteriales bacterium]
MRHLPRRQVLIGDAATVLAGLPGRSVDMILTSPPYFRLRDYQVAGQLGLEDHVCEWVAALRQVAAELARVLVASGSLWLNLGDSYATHQSQGAAAKSLLLAPERLLLALGADGWIVRNKIVWAKTNHMPSPVADRLSCGWEVIYLLVRSPRYFFDLDAIRQPHRSRPPARQAAGAAQETVPSVWRGPNSDGSSGLARMKAQGRVGHPLGKNPGDVWALAAGNFRGNHYAAFPRSLAERAIQAGCPVQRCRACQAPWRQQTLRAIGGLATRGVLGPSCACREGGEPGLVLDPFMGAGTTALVAETLERDWLGVELNPDFVALTEARLEDQRAA